MHERELPAHITGMSTPSSALRTVLVSMKSDPGTDTAQDVILTVDLGASTQRLRGALSILDDDDVVCLFRTIHTDSDGRSAPIASATDSAHSEYPTYIPVNRIALIEWAVNDYTRTATR